MTPLRAVVVLLSFGSFLHLALAAQTPPAPDVPPRVPPEEAPKTKVLDLMQALKQSLGGAQEKAEEKRKDGRAEELRPPLGPLPARE